MCDTCGKYIIPWATDEGDLVCSRGLAQIAGLIHDAETADQIERARELASWLDRFAVTFHQAEGFKGKWSAGYFNHRDRLEQRLNFLATAHPGNTPIEPTSTKRTPTASTSFASSSRTASGSGTTTAG